MVRFTGRNFWLVFFRLTPPGGLFFCLLFFCSSLSVCAEELSADREDILFVSSAAFEGQTEVSAWVEAADKPEDTGSDDEESGGKSVRTGEQNTAVVLIILFLFSGILIAVEGIRRNTE